jgi:hypothetical protein
MGSIAVANHPPLVFNGINSEQYAMLAGKARVAGIDINGNSGTALKYGVQVAWNYVAEQQQLTFQCLKTPFFISEHDVESRIRALINETLAA